MPKSCTALKGITFLLCLITALDLHCLPSVHSAPGLPKSSQHCSCTGAAPGAAWHVLCSALPFGGLHSAIWRLVWAPRPKWCALSWQLSAAVYRLGYAWWPTFPMSCTCRLCKVFVLRIPPNSSLQMIFHKCLVTGWRATGFSAEHSSACPLVSHRASALLKSVWLNLPSLCLEIVEHRLFYVSYTRTSLHLKSCESLWKVVNHWSL